ncbi:MAG: radical SAM protein, partial [Candidatus Aenigmatarchaeota archaeon]
SNGVDLPYLSAATMFRPWSPILTSRGCMFNCYFCNKRTFGYGFRALTPENVIKEIETLIEKYKVKEIDFYDDSWNQDLKRAERILDMIIERGWDVHLRCSNGIRVDKITKKFIQKFKKAGGDWISLGIESGNQKILNTIPKMITLNQVRKSVKIIKESGIIVSGFFMLGLLGDTEKTMQDTINFAKELNLDIAQFTIATPYPGTRMYDMVKEKGKLLISDWDTFHHTSGKMLYEYPGTAKPEIVEKMYKKAHKEYYLRPIYIFKQLLKIKTKEHLKFMFRGFKTVIRIQKGIYE